MERLSLARSFIRFWSRGNRRDTGTAERTHRLLVDVLTLQLANPAGAIGVTSNDTSGALPLVPSLFIFIVAGLFNYSSP